MILPVSIRSHFQQATRYWLSWLLFLTLTACSRPNPPLIIGFINSSKVMQQYHGTAAKRHQLELFAIRWQRSLDSLTTALGAARLSVTERELRVNRYRVMLQQKLQAASQQADQELLREVNQYLKTYGESQHYNFILGANESGNIVYAAPDKDLTLAIIRGLNQQYDRLHPLVP